MGALCPLTDGSKPIAVLLRGTAFRPGAARNESDCLPSAVASQLAAASSLMRHVVEPLEAACDGVGVELYAAMCAPTRVLSQCAPLHAMLRSALGRRVVAAQSCGSDGQHASLAEALSLFKQHKRHAASAYALILVARYDFVFTQPLTRWDGANLSRFNFLSRCEPPRNASSPTVALPDSLCPTGSSHDCEPCVNDLLLTMPGTLFDAFAEHAFGHPGCFAKCHAWCGPRSLAAHEDGHRCTRPVMRAIDQRAGLPPAEALGVLTRWRPDADGNVRDPTPVGGVLCSKDPGDAALPVVCGPRAPS